MRIILFATLMGVALARPDIGLHPNSKPPVDSYGPPAAGLPTEHYYNTRNQDINRGYIPPSQGIQIPKIDVRIESQRPIDTNNFASASADLTKFQIPDSVKSQLYLSAAKNIKDNREQSTGQYIQSSNSGSSGAQFSSGGGSSGVTSTQLFNDGGSSSSSGQYPSGGGSSGGQFVSSTGGSSGSQFLSNAGGLSSTNQFFQNRNSGYRQSTHTTSNVNYVQTGEQQVHRHVYFYKAPEEPEEPAARVTIPIAPPQKNYKIIFIKTPTYKSQAAQIIPPQPQNEEKTLVYVLVKKPEEAGEIKITPPEPTKPSKPEVYFIRYKSEKEAQDAVSHIHGSGTGIDINKSTNDQYSSGGVDVSSIGGGSSFVGNDFTSSGQPGGSSIISTNRNTGTSDTTIGNNDYTNTQQGGGSTNIFSTNRNSGSSVSTSSKVNEANLPSSITGEGVFDDRILSTAVHPGGQQQYKHLNTGTLTTFSNAGTGFPLPSGVSSSSSSTQILSNDNSFKSQTSAPYSY